MNHSGLSYVRPHAYRYLTALGLAATLAQHSAAAVTALFDSMTSRTTGGLGADTLLMPSWLTSYVTPVGLAVMQGNNAAAKVSLLCCVWLAG
jgi:hypothetical protein